MGDIADKSLNVSLVDKDEFDITSSESGAKRGIDVHVINPSEVASSVTISDPNTPANKIAVDASGAIKVQGVATETTVVGIRTDLGTDGAIPPEVLGGGTGVRGWLRSIYEKLTGSVAVTGTFWQATQPVSANSLPLPTGAATGAKQDTGNTSLSNLETKTGEVQAIPTANTILGRLKDVYDRLLDGIFSIKTTAGNITGKSEGASVYSLDVNLRSSSDGVGVIIRDHSIPSQQAHVDASGSLQVVNQAPVAPPATTPVMVVAYDSVITNSDTSYTITNGKVLYIQRLYAGAEGSVDGSVVELWYDPNGTGVGMTVIVPLFVNGSSQDAALLEGFTGNGTRRILMRRQRNDGGAKIIFGKFVGYEV